jgi:hypothetical protein
MGSFADHCGEGCDIAKLSDMGGEVSKEMHLVNVKMGLLPVDIHSTF